MTVHKLYPQTLKDFGKREIVPDSSSSSADNGNQTLTAAEEGDDSSPRVYFLPSMERNELYGQHHPVVATDQWEDNTDLDQMEVPLVIPFQDSQLCEGLPLVLLTAQYLAVDTMVPLNRNPV